MDGNVIGNIIISVIGLVTMLVGRRANQYFQSGSRAAKADLVRIMAKAALAYVELQQGVSTPNADLIRLAIDELYRRLVAQGFNEVAARDLAKSEIAVAAAEKGYPLREIQV